MKTIVASRARVIWSRLLSRVHHRGDRFAICRNGEIVAALIPITDAELLDELAHESDIEEARAALRLDSMQNPMAWGEMKRFTEIDR